ncbi:alpha/beta fold hydrolase [Nocardioides sp. R-C-SC26]|uniref:alpha/beta fold hydrolase n=1 Tax=Nocardioides sp. R-C-SC26 TaxID=2870414 RepID=UPI001E3E1416|nr:alpha/beta hydrolase [Nocardioides sp. R-C-SC26]
MSTASTSGNRRRWLWGSIGGLLGVAAAGTAIGLLRQQRAISHTAGDDVPLGTLRSAPIHVIATDGTPLHVEVDELEDSGRAGGRSPRVTVIFAHGYCLNLDSWHFQRAAYRGLVRAVYYDQRSHGRSGRCTPEHATIDQLGRDLKQIIDEVAPEGPVVLVGHSMGGMTIVAFAEQFPELIGTKVLGVGLIATTAGGLDPSRILLPMLPARLTGRATHRAVATLQRGHRTVDAVRRVGRVIANSATNRFAFGSDVPESYLRFVDDMLSATPFEVVADFFPSFGSLDKFHAVEALSTIPVSIICGTQDKLTSIGHSRKLHAQIAGSRLLECEGAGHMVTMERHEHLNAELDQLITAALDRAGAR